MSSDWIRWFNQDQEDCCCFCAIKLTHKVYDYETHELQSDFSEIFEDFVDLVNGEFEFPWAYCTAMDLGSTSFESWFAPYDYNGNEIPVDWKRENAFTWTADYLDHGRKRVKYQWIHSARIEILAYHVMPPEYKENP